MGAAEACRAARGTVVLFSDAGSLPNIFWFTTSPTAVTLASSSSSTWLSLGWRPRRAAACRALGQCRDTISPGGWLWWQQGSSACWEPLGPWYSSPMASPPQLCSTSSPSSTLSKVSTHLELGSLGLGGEDGGGRSQPGCGLTRDPKAPVSSQHCHTLPLVRAHQAGGTNHQQGAAHGSQLHPLHPWWFSSKKDIP